MRWDDRCVFGAHQGHGKVLREAHPQIIVDRISALRGGEPQDGDRALVGWDGDRDRLNRWFSWGLDDGFWDHLWLLVFLHHERQENGSGYQEREKAEGDGLRPFKR